MKETIIYSSRLNEVEFLRFLSLNNIPSFNVRIYNSFSLASEALERSNYVLSTPLIQKEDEVFKYIKILENKRDGHFTSFLDIKHLATTIRNIRLLITKDNELEEITKLLSEELKLDNISLIISSLKDYLEDTSFIDFIGYLRLAINHASNTFNEIITLKEERISPLEKLLLEKLSNNNVKEISLLDLLKIRKREEVTYKGINPYYGIDNEIEEVLATIYKNNYKLDETSLILLSDNYYLSSLYSLSLNKKIPMSFSNGLPITLFKPHHLLKSLLSLERVHKFDVNGYKELFKSNYFNKPQSNYLDTLIELLGRLKISFDENENNKRLNEFIELKNRDVFLYEFYRIKSEDVDFLLDELKSFANDMSLGMSHFLNKYLTINNELEEIALSHINNILVKAKTIEDIQIRNTYIDSIDSLLIAPSISSEGAINVTSLSKAFTNIRKHNFILGNSAHNFPGKRIEDFLIDDATLLKISKKAITSNKKIENNNLDFDNLVSILSSLNSDIYLSYSFYDLTDPNEINPSSKIFEIVSKYSDKDYLKKLKEKTNYFSSELNDNKAIGEAYIHNNRINITSLPTIEECNTSLINYKKYSPSDLDVFFDCPKKFYAAKILGIKEDNEYNRYKVIDGNHFGSLLHYLMDRYYKLDEKEFEDETIAIFNDYLKFNITNVDPSYDLNEFIKCANNGYMYLKEFDSLEFEHWEEGNILDINFLGRYDCLAKKNNEYYLIDFKSEKRVERRSDDPSSIRQILLYLKLLNDKGIKIKKGQYYYFRYNKIVDVAFDNFNISTLLGEIELFKECLKTRTFKLGDEPNCKFCPLKDFCDNKKKKDK